MLDKEALRRQSDGFGRTRHWDEGALVESLSGEPMGVADMHVIDIVGPIAINEAQVAEFGIDPADYPGVIVLNERGRTIFPPPPSAWDPVTRKIINQKESTTHE